MATIDDKLFRFVYIVSMRDATLQKSYKSQKKWLEEDAIVSLVQPILAPFVQKIIENRFVDQSSFDKAFIKAAGDLCNVINTKAGNDEFSFGNAQKLINIMTKYFYIQAYRNPSIRDGFKYCHCPMDNQLLKKVKEETKDPIFNDGWGDLKFVKVNGENIFPEKYLKFQETVRRLAHKDGLTAVEYDYWVR